MEPSRGLFPVSIPIPIPIATATGGDVLEKPTCITPRSEYKQKDIFPASLTLHAERTPPDETNNGNDFHPGPPHGVP